MGEEQSASFNQSSTEIPSINQTITFISSLISLSHSIKIFPTKWHSIRIKLESLLSNFAAIEDCEASSLSVSIASISSTLKNCNDLARRCSDFSFTGKLQTQSDLDMLSAKLEIGINSLSDIYAKGLLTQRYAIVVSKPSASSSKEDLRFYINDLLSRFKIGESDVKKKALTEFNEAILEDDRYVKIALEIDGFISVLMKFLDCSEDFEIQQQAAMAMCSIAGFESCRGALIAAGMIGSLIRVLELGIDETSKELAARCLMKVTENSDNAWAVSAHGGATALLNICRNCNEFGNELISLACGVLKNIVGVDEIGRFVVEEGAILVFLDLVRFSTHDTTLIYSIDLLRNVGCRDESTWQTMVKKGGICALTRVLNPRVNVTMKTREAAFRGIVDVYGNSVGNVMDSALIEHVLYFLRHGDFALQELALKLALWLCGTCLEAKEVMGNMGFIPVLVGFLESKSVEVRELAGETLSGMMVVGKNRRRFVGRDENVGVLLQMLDSEEEDSGYKKALVSILRAVAGTYVGRKKIARLGHLKSIDKVVEVEVLGTKKNVRMLLSWNGFRSLLNGIWHS